MRRELIPDAVLWAFTGSERELVKLPGYGVVCCSDMGGFGLDLARELLALRGAARRMLTKARSVYDRLCSESGQSPAQDGECWAEAEALDDLLPKEPA